MSIHPVVLPSNRPQDRFYLGGERITAFRSELAQGPRTPEDWIASTTSCRGCGSDVGQTRLPNGTFLKDEIAQNPVAWLGQQHVEKFGADTKILVKLLDAGERLPVHAHPHVSWAKRHVVGAKHGKAEAWYFLTGGEVFLGLQRDVSADELYELVESQDIDKLTGLMHRLTVQSHQTVYVPPGTLHAIGKGLLIVEVQEPEDMSILVEWKGFKIDGWKDGFLGLDPKRALESVQRRGQSDEEIRSLVNAKAGYGEMIVSSSRKYFRLERIAIDGQVETPAGFAIIIVLEGSTQIATEKDGDLLVEAKQGNTIVVPHQSGKLTFRGVGEVLVARPPSAA
ncbi:Cupin, RmlC-type [Niveomyces insectorum RCEF 264]|uniref:Cupin, RmlC-type n=1 Tax=Niveomyces insectorum RCEF 264 TaxID=1081102 RepID=A0A162MFM2_9HYPO|nr:Cupin, RmlC-type [Niveomyces insectorum RCEF 264]